MQADSDILAESDYQNTSESSFDPGDMSSINARVRHDRTAWLRQATPESSVDSGDMSSINSHVRNDRTAEASDRLSVAIRKRIRSSARR